MWNEEKNTTKICLRNSHNDSLLTRARTGFLSDMNLQSIDCAISNVQRGYQKVYPKFQFPIMSNIICPRTCSDSSTLVELSHFHVHVIMSLLTFLMK